MSLRRVSLAIEAAVITACALLGWHASRPGTRPEPEPAAAGDAGSGPTGGSSAAAVADAGGPLKITLPARRTISGAPPREMTFRDVPPGIHAADAYTQRVRRETFEALLKFRDEAELTDEQWRYFLAELQETAVSFGFLLNDQGFNRITEDDFRAAAEELGRDLEDRLGSRLSERQMGTFRFRFRADRLPRMLAVGNILQDPDDPDRRAWTLPNDTVLPNDVPLPSDAAAQNL